MTREEKVEKKKARRQIRVSKRKIKNQSYLNTMRIEGLNGISQGRKRKNGSLFICEMRYASCEARGYCNGDC